MWSSQIGQNHCSNFPFLQLSLWKELSIIVCVHAHSCSVVSSSLRLHGPYLLINFHGFPITHTDTQGSFQIHLNIYHKVLALNTGPTCCCQTSQIPFHIWFSLPRWADSPAFLWINSFFLQGLTHARHRSRIYFPRWPQDAPSHVFILQWDADALPSQLCSLSPLLKTIWTWAYGRGDTVCF